GCSASWGGRGSCPSRCARSATTSGAAWTPTRRPRTDRPGPRSVRVLVGMAHGTTHRARVGHRRRGGPSGLASPSVRIGQTTGAGIAALALLLAACGGDDDGDTTDASGTDGSVYAGELEDGSTLTVTLDVPAGHPEVAPFEALR